MSELTLLSIAWVLVIVLLCLAMSIIRDLEKGKGENNEN